MNNIEFKNTEYGTEIELNGATLNNVRKYKIEAKKKDEGISVVMIEFEIPSDQIHMA